MKRLVLCLVAVAAMGCGAARGPQNVRSTEGNFQADFPAPTRHKTNSQSGPQGPIKIQGFTAETDNGENAYMVMFNDYDQPQAHKADPQAVLQGVRQGVVRSVNGTVVRSSELSLDGHPGIEFQMTGTKNGRSLKAVWRAYLVGNRLYQVSVISLGTWPSTEKVDGFLDSFALLEK